MGDADAKQSFFVVVKTTMPERTEGDDLVDAALVLAIGEE